MSNIKTKISNGWQKVKTWVGNHKKEVILGTALTVVGAIGVVVSNAGKKSHSEEGEEILAALETAIESDDDWFEEHKDIDRYVIDTAVMNTLPAGTYDVFDVYENERVDYVVEKVEESMET